LHLQRFEHVLRDRELFGGRDYPCRKRAAFLIPGPWRVFAVMLSAMPQRGASARARAAHAK
jgi:hypothetical protein